MLVKLGDVWVDPLEVVSIKEYVALPNGSLVSDVEIRLHEGISYIVVSVGEHADDNFAAIVNEALTPKQSWSEEVSEPEK